jgi:hypothetical protein
MQSCASHYERKESHIEIACELGRLLGGPRSTSIEGDRSECEADHVKKALLLAEMGSKTGRPEGGICIIHGIERSALSQISLAFASYSTCTYIGKVT